MLSILQQIAQYIHKQQQFNVQQNEMWLGKIVILKSQSYVEIIVEH